MEGQELYIFTGGRGNIRRETDHMFRDLVKAAQFAQLVNGKIEPMLDYDNDGFHTVYSVRFDYIEAEYKEVP